MLPFKLIYSSKYDLNLGDHVFPSAKYRLIHEKLLEEGVATPEDFLEPSPASDADIRLVHSELWVHKLLTGTCTYYDIQRMEIPYSREMVEAVWLAAGGSTLAARCALQDGAALNIGGGFHHAYPDYGEGFCVIHDVAVAIRTLQRDGAIERALVVDCDVHQGNGTAAIFGADETVFTVSLHQENNYPSPKPPSNIDVHLADGVGDEEYLACLQAALEKSFEGEDKRYDLLCYVAGADPYYQDHLGGLMLTMNGLQRRDAMVFETVRRRKLPVMVTLAGGYAKRVEDTVQIHVNTVRALREAL
jgi:acetoin utilization deacetylase AcuC-like enzyme